MTCYEFGEVLVVPIPFTDMTARKRRLAVVISSNEYNLQSLDLILISVTSQLNSAISIGEVMIHGWQEAGFFKPSVIKPVITTVEKRRVYQKLGRLRGDDLAALQNMLPRIVGQGALCR